MLTALRIISPANLRNSRFKVVYCINSKRNFVRKISTELQVQKFKTQSKVLSQFGTEQRCGFHTSRPCCIPPVLALILRPVIQIGAFIFGRSFKKWWKQKTKEEKQYYIDWLMSKKSSIYGEGFFYFTFNY